MKKIFITTFMAAAFAISSGMTTAFTEGAEVAPTLTDSGIPMSMHTARSRANAFLVLFIKFPPFRAGFAIRSHIYPTVFYFTEYLPFFL